MNTRKLFACCVLFLMALTVKATEPQRKFSPEKFQQELEAYITAEASLTQQEAAKFFPVYREMQEKQRAVHGKMKQLCKVKPEQEPACKKVVQKRDELELEQKRIQQAYHNKFFNVLPASKVYDVLNAEDRFYRKTFKNWGRGHGTQPAK